MLLFSVVADLRVESWTQPHLGLRTGTVEQLPANERPNMLAKLLYGASACAPAAKPRIVTDNATPCVDGALPSPGGMYQCKVVCNPKSGEWFVRP
jgi:hypothetical protein